MVRIATYSLNADYAAGFMIRRPHHIRLMCHEKFGDEARKLQVMLPGIEVRLLHDLHARYFTFDGAFGAISTGQEQIAVGTMFVADVPTLRIYCVGADGERFSGFVGDGVLHGRGREVSIAAASLILRDRLGRSFHLVTHGLDLGMDRLA